MGLIKLENLNNNVLYGLWQITETEEYFFDNYFFNEEELKSLSKIKFLQKRLQWLSSRAIIKEIVNNAIVLKDTTNRPYLKNYLWNISISHSNSYSTAIISKNKNLNVAIDIEKISFRIKNITEKFITASEYKLKPADMDEKLFLHLIWGIKECAYKLYNSINPNFIGDIEVLSIDTRNMTSYCIIQKNNIKDLYYYINFDNYLIVYTYR